MVLSESKGDSEKMGILNIVGPISLAKDMHGVNKQQLLLKRAEMGAGI